MSNPPKLTLARRRALAVLAAHRYPLTSNETNLERGLVYWQSADWLLEVGYARPDRTNRQLLRATQAGIERATAEGIPLAVERTDASSPAGQVR